MMRGLMLVGLLVAAMVPQAAQAVRIASTTYYFTGTCSDCVGTGKAELVLSGYTPGTAITSSNFVSFHYDGTNLLSAFTITPSANNSYSGSIGSTLPGAFNVSIISSTEEFIAQSSGSWCVGPNCLADFGNSGSFSDTASVPEPFSLALMVTGLAGTALSRRRGAG